MDGRPYFVVMAGRKTVMAGLDPAILFVPAAWWGVDLSGGPDHVDGRDKPGHDGLKRLRHDSSGRI
jgi:hypothetical protein